MIIPHNCRRLKEMYVTTAKNAILRTSPCAVGSYLDELSMNSIARLFVQSTRWR